MSGRNNGSTRRRIELQHASRRNGMSTTEIAAFSPLDGARDVEGLAEVSPPGASGPAPEPVRPKRVLFFGKKKSRSCCTGALVDALRAQGLRVKWVNCSLLKRWMGTFGMKQVVRMIRRRYRPDLCFVFFHDLPHVLMPEFSEEIPTVVWIEEPIKYIDSAQVDYVRSARVVCLSTPSLVWAYRSLGIRNATFQMSGFSPAYHKPHALAGKRQYERDLVYIGGPGSMGSRPEFLAWLSERHDLEIFGRRESWLPYLRRFPQLRLVGEVRPHAYAEVCARSRIVIGLNQTHESRLYFSNRVFLTLACRGFHLTRHVPGIDDVFEDGRHLAWFETRDNCLERIDEFLGDDDRREEIAAAGYELVVSKHRYHDRVREILDILRLERDLDCPLDQVDEVLEIGTDERNETAAVLYPRRRNAGEFGDDAAIVLPRLRRASGWHGS